jgi:hypothetical protein
MNLIRLTTSIFFGRLILPAVLVLSHLLAAAGPVNFSEPNVPPPLADLRPMFKTWELAPLPQGSRGTCSVFVVAGALEYASARHHHAGQRFSVEYLNWASNQVVGQCVDGGFFADLWKGFSAFGICPAPDMPYQDRFDPNLAPSEEARIHADRCLSDDLRNHWIKPWDINTGLTDAQLTAVKQVIGQGWPVCGGFRWPKHPVWKDDVLEMAPPENVFDGHSLLLVGYRDDPQQPGGGVFVFRNSNSDHSEGWMTYQYAAAYMNDAMWISTQPDRKRQEPVNRNGSSEQP